MAGAPDEASLRKALTDAGFVDIIIDRKPESRSVIAQWMPGSGAEDYVVSANVSARKPMNGSCDDVLASPKKIQKVIIQSESSGGG